MTLIRIRNIGPIRSADIHLADLTIFIGPNNAGKSVAATVLHSAFGAPSISAVNMTFSQRGRRMIQRGAGGSFSYVIDEPPALDELEGLFNDFLAEEPGAERLLSSPRARALTDSVITTILQTFAAGLLEGLQQAFRSEIDDLVMVNHGRRMPARIDVVHTNPTWELSITLGRPRPRVQIVRRPTTAQTYRLLRRAIGNRKPGAAFTANRIIPEALFRVNRQLLREFSAPSYYLPAARSGILQSHRQLAAALVRSSVRAGLEPMQVPQMSGLVADFISQLIEVSDSFEGDFEEVASFLETDILQGSVDVEDSGPYPEIAYHSNDCELPIHRTSSMVSELAPVVLYLRHLLNARDVLIIEEPEAHLHPASQLKVAEGISRAVQSGLRVVLTTHSDYLFQALNNRIRGGQVEQQALFDTAGFTSLTRGGQGAEVAAYAFRPSPIGTAAALLERSPEFGISDEDFALVSQLLYDETVTLDQAIIESEE